LQEQVKQGVVETAVEFGGLGYVAATTAAVDG